MFWILFIFLLLCGLTSFKTALFIFAVLTVAFLIAGYFFNKQKREEETQKAVEHENARVTYALEKEQQRTYYQQQVEGYEKLYGPMDKEIRIDDYYITSSILVFSESRRIILCGDDLSFDEILGSKIIHEKVEDGFGYYDHEYTVLVNVDSLSDPIIKIEVYEDREIAREIDALMKVIIHSNKKSHP